MDSTPHASKHKWLVLVCVLLQAFAYLGTALSFGALFVEMLDKFKGGRSSIAVVQALFIGFSITPGVLTGLLVTRFGVVKVTIAGSLLTSSGFIMSFFANSVIFVDICIGVIAGLGVSFIHISGAVALAYSFVGYQRILAIALQGAAVSLGIVLIPYLLKFLLNYYGLNGTFLILGGLFLNSLLAAIVFYFDHSIKLNDISESGVENSQSSTEHSTDHKQFISYLSECFSLSYILVVIGTALVVSSINAFMIMIVDMFVWKGYSIQEGMLIFIPYGLCGTIARIIPGLVKLKKGANSIIAPIIFCFSGSVGFVVMYVFDNYVLMIIGNALTGFSIGGVLSAGTVIVAEIFSDNQRIGKAIGLLYTMVGTFTAAAGPFYGFLRDSTGSYGRVMLITAGIQTAGMVMYIIVCISNRRLPKPNSKDRADVHDKLITTFRISKANDLTDINIH